jgi:Beta-xylosidase
MFFSVEEHIAVAVSDNPLGPFKQENQKPLLETKAIDAHLFIDSDGRKYLYYVAFTNGNVVWMCEMNNDLMSIKPNTIRKCFEASQPWEKSDKQPVALVNEGPFMLKHNNLYYLVYSANHYANPDYGIGYALSSSPTGPWAKFAGNPILQSPDTLRGTGHCSLFTDTEGILNIVYHAHYSQKEVQPRIVYINRCSFVHNDSTGIDELKVMPQRIVPQNGDVKILKSVF